MGDNVHEHGAADETVAEPIRILLIDDEPESMQPVTQALRSQGWHVGSAVDGNQGFHRAQAQQPDLILLDLYLPGMDGFAVCRLLKESARTRDVPVIYLSVANDDAERLQGLHDGGVDYIDKIRSPEEVVARVRVHLGRWGAAVDDGVHADPASDAASTDDIIVNTAMHSLRSRLADLPSLDELAASVGVARKKLSALFREHTGMTVFAWIREERIKLCRDWLAHSDMSVQDIAEQAGFQSAANFATAFRKRLGVSPSEYRQTQRDGS